MLFYMGRVLALSCYRFRFILFISLSFSTFIMTILYHKRVHVLKRSTVPVTTYVYTSAVYYAESENRNKYDSETNSKHSYPMYHEDQIPMPLIDLTANKTNNCAYFPKVNHLKFNNIYWQIMSADNGLNVYMYSAYYDNRTILKNNAMVRIIVMISKPLKQIDTYCNLWSENKELKVGKVFSLHKLSPTYPAPLYPYLITCAVPKEWRAANIIPAAVSLVNHKCGSATNLLRVINNIPPKGQEKNGIAVCIKGLDFANKDISVYLVEWLELLFTMGVDKVTMYEYALHPNISRVVRHYQDIGLVELIPLTLPGEAPNVPTLRHRYLDTSDSNHIYVNQILNEKIPFNDCFYRNMNLFEYISVLDYDEIIIPKVAYDWGEMMKKIKYKSRISAYQFWRVVVLNHTDNRSNLDKTIPNYMYILKNIHRSKIYEINPKSIYTTERALVLSTHVAKFCLTERIGYYKCFFKKINPDIAHVLHFRNSCKEGQEAFCGLDKTVKDKEVRKYQQVLVDRVSKVLKNQRFIK
ncbi:unnamed protein product [Meganyctiphanes norvegica]|uniref:Glycosyltransferase family 92 protein n=1 Tax=Meganyctiphanes norvegica TaxID=48144 RepID=A0AAV2PYQ5_MEGNR